MKLIDAHFHVWERSQTKQRDILAAEYLQRDVSWEDYRAATQGIALEQCVNVHVNDLVDPIPEVQYVSSVAARAHALAAMVAWAPLESLAIGEHLDRLSEFPLVVGVRRGTQQEADPLFCTREAFVAGARLVGRRGLVCELCVKEHQLAGVAELAHSVPETTFVVDHFGKPDLERRDPHRWREAVKVLAQCPNVIMKVSVVVNSDRDPPLAREVIEPYIVHAIECFGWKRVAFGSNWPVSTAVIEYRAWAAMVNDVLADATGVQLAGLFAENARRIYRLGRGPEALPAAPARS